jgi:hypothetical protein
MANNSEDRMNDLIELKYKHDQARERIRIESERRSRLSNEEEILEIPYFLRSAIWPQKDQEAVRAYITAHRKIEEKERAKEQKHQHRIKQNAAIKAESERQAKLERRKLRKQQIADRLQRKSDQRRNQDLVYNAIISGHETYGQLIKKLEMDPNALKLAIRWLMKKNRIGKVSPRRYGPHWRSNNKEEE